MVSRLQADQLRGAPRATKAGPVARSATRTKGAPKLGRLWPAFNAEEAHEAAKYAAGLLRGDDPKAERARNRRRRSSRTLSRCSAPTPSAEPGTIKDYEGRIRRVLLPTFKGRWVADIGIDDITRRTEVRRQADRGNRALAVLSS